MYNKMYDFLLVVVKEGVAAEFQIEDSRTEVISPLSSRTSKRKQDLDVAKLFEGNGSKNKKMMAFFENVLAQSNKDNVPPDNTVFKIMQKIDQSLDFARKIEIDLSRLKEEKISLQALDPETITLSEIKDVDTKIEHKTTLLKSFMEEVMKQNEELK